MKRTFKQRTVVLIAVLAFLTLTAAECSFSTANISDAYMSTNHDGTDRVTTYPQDAVFYAIVDLANAPDDTTVKAQWYAVNAADTEPNFFIDEASVTGSDGRWTFNLANEAGFLWPTGTYRVDLYLNDKLDRSLDFSVQ
jgi:hypothetical protein